MKDTFILAIESSCDETAASDSKKRQDIILSNVILPRSRFTLCMEVLCRKSLHVNILRKSIR